MKYIIFLIIVFLCSCVKNNDGKIESINVSLNKDIIKASHFIKDASVIKLETNENCLIQRISKIQYINGKIYILDVANNSLLIFDKDGAFDKKLQKIGGGPDEYLQLIDFYVQDDLLYIMDFATQSILKYDSDLEFIGKIRYETFGSKILVKDSIFWIYNEPTGQKEDYHFTCLNHNGEILNQEIPRGFHTHQYNWGGDISPFSLSKEVLFFSPKYGNIIYCNNNDNNNIDPIYKINFSKNNFPENENINDFDITDPGFRYVLKQNFYLSDNYLIFDYLYDGNRNFCFYDLAECKVLSGLVVNDIIKDFRFFPRWGNDNYLIEEVLPIYIKEDFTTLVDYNGQLANISEDDNPVVVIYTLR